MSGSSARKRKERDVQTRIPVAASYSRAELRVLALLDETIISPCSWIALKMWSKPHATAAAGKILARLEDLMAVARTPAAYLVKEYPAGGWIRTDFGTKILNSK